jgi:hypothetical protein
MKSQCRLHAPHGQVCKPQRPRDYKPIDKYPYDLGSASPILARLPREDSPDPITRGPVGALTTITDWKSRRQHIIARSFGWQLQMTSFELGSGAQAANRCQEPKEISHEGPRFRIGYNAALYNLDFGGELYFQRNDSFR